MHVAFVCHEYPPARHGGVGVFVQAMARGLVRAGHQASVFGVTPSEPEEARDEGVRVVRVRPARGPGKAVWNATRLWARVLSTHRSERIDLIEGAELTFGLAPPALPIPMLVRMHGGHRFFAEELGAPTLRHKRWLEGRSLRNASYLAAVSEYVGQKTREIYGLSQPIQVIPNSIDLARFDSARPACARERVARRVVFVGTLCEKKGVRQLVASFAEIARGCPGARLTIAGPDTKIGIESFQARLEGMIPPHLADRVEFLGRVPNTSVPALLSSAEVCVFPSHMEAMPLAWLEGMASGRAVVAADIGPAREVIRNGIDGLLCDPFSPSDIAAQILRLLRDSELATRLGIAARQRVEQEFSLDVALHRNLAFYERCTA